MKNKKDPRSISITDIEHKLEIFTNQAPTDFVGDKSKTIRNFILSSCLFQLQVHFCVNFSADVMYY